MSEPTGHPPGSFCWHELATRDAAAARTFYAQMFGWTAEEKEMPGGAGTYVLMSAGAGHVAGMFQMEGPMFEGVPPHWMAYVAVEDCDATAEKATSLGATLKYPPMDVPGVGRMTCFADPQGGHLSIFQPGEHPGAAQQPPIHGTFCWTELATTDREAAVGFYTQLFGWEPMTRDMGPITYTSFMCGDRPVGGAMQMTEEWGGAPPHWMPYLAVDDCDASAAKAAELGGVVKVPPTSIPTVGRFSMFFDPTQAAISVITLETPAGTDCE